MVEAGVKRLAAGGRGDRARRLTEILPVVALWRGTNGRCGAVMGVVDGPASSLGKASFFSSLTESASDDELSSDVSLLSESDSHAHGMGELPRLCDDLFLLPADSLPASYGSLFASIEDSAWEVGGEGCCGTPEECHDSTLWKDSSLSLRSNRGC